MAAFRSMTFLLYECAKRSAQETLGTPPPLQFYASLEAAKAEFDKEYDAVTSHYDLMAEFGIRGSELLHASYATLDNDMMSLRDAMWAGGWRVLCLNLYDALHVVHWWSV